MHDDVRQRRRGVEHEGLRAQERARHEARRKVGKQPGPCCRRPELVSQQPRPGECDGDADQRPPGEQAGNDESAPPSHAHRERATFGQQDQREGERHEDARGDPDDEFGVVTSGRRSGGCRRREDAEVPRGDRGLHEAERSEHPDRRPPSREQSPCTDEHEHERQDGEQRPPDAVQVGVAQRVHAVQVESTVPAADPGHPSRRRGIRHRDAEGRQQSEAHGRGEREQGPEGEDDRDQREQAPAFTAGSFASAGWRSVRE